MPTEDDQQVRPPITEATDTEPVQRLNIYSPDTAVDNACSDTTGDLTQHTADHSDVTMSPPLTDDYRRPLTDIEHVITPLESENTVEPTVGIDECDMFKEAEFSADYIAKLQCHDSKVQSMILKCLE